MSSSETSFNVDSRHFVDNYVWQDRELRFDCKEIALKPRPGEKLIDSINSVEDTKGNFPIRPSILDYWVFVVIHSFINDTLGPYSLPFLIQATTEKGAPFWSLIFVSYGSPTPIRK